MGTNALATVLHTLGHAASRRLAASLRTATTRRRSLRVGVDIRPFYEPLTGVGWYLHNLLHELARRDDLELILLGDARVTDQGPRLHATLPRGVEPLVFDLRGKPPARFDRPLTAAAYVAWMELAACDVVFGANYFLPRLHSAIARRRVVTVHDLTYKRHPELLQRETLKNLERHMAREVALADAIVCVSESTRRDLLDAYEVDPSRVFAVHSGLGIPAAEEPIEGLPPRYILFVSTVEPRKDLATLLDAYERVREGYGGSLVVVGKIGWESRAVTDRLRDPGVVHLDYLDAGQLSTVYRRADVFVMPSIYEGFGFPLLEAMSRGVPSIAAASSSLPEIGGDAALYFPPRNAEVLAARLERLLADGSLRAELSDRGLRRAATFTWTRAADETFKILQRVAGR